MEILTRESDRERFEEALYEIEEWRFVWAHWDMDAPKECGAQHVHHLGWSGDERTWAFSTRRLAASDPVDDAPPTEMSGYQEVDFVLVGAPAPNRHVFQKLFFRLHAECEARGPLDGLRIDEIAADPEFARYPPASYYLPEAPEAWRDLRAGLAHGFNLSEGAGICKEVWQAYDRDTLEEILKVVCAERHDGILVGYSLVVSEGDHGLEWQLDAPLARRGDAEPERREPAQGDAPWEEGPDLRLLSLYQEAPWDMRSWTPRYYAKHSVRLLVAGATRHQAIENWDRCARALRRIRRRLVIPKGSPLYWKEGAPAEE